MVPPSIIRKSRCALKQRLEHLEVNKEIFNKRVFVLREACHQTAAAGRRTVGRSPHQRVSTKERRPSTASLCLLFFFKKSCKRDVGKRIPRIGYLSDGGKRRHSGDPLSRTMEPFTDRSVAHCCSDTGGLLQETQGPS